jgi:hypothetical protein
MRSTSSTGSASAQGLDPEQPLPLRLRGQMRA